MSLLPARLCEIALATTCQLWPSFLSALPTGANIFQNRVAHPPPKLQKQARAQDIMIIL